MPQKIFIFSGLGADHRVFHKMNFQEFEPVFIHWLEPLPKETIEAYALRISRQITESKPIVLGISFGGIMAIEVSKLLPFQKLILLLFSKHNQCFGQGWCFKDGQYCDCHIDNTEQFI